MKPHRVILASGSPRRKQILEQLGLSFDVILSDFDESQFHLDAAPGELVMTLSELKGDELSRQYPEALVISSDTLVVLGKEVLGKPVDRTEAKIMLQRLSENQHQVYSGVSLQWQEKQIRHRFHEITDVTFRELSLEDVDFYVEHYQPFDKAGGYAIQDWAAVFIESIAGCYNNVVGFPLSRFYLEVKELSIELPFQHKLAVS